MKNIDFTNFETSSELKDLLKNSTNSTRILDETPVAVPTDKDFYVSFIKYVLNPYMATPEFRKVAGPYAIDKTFPLYAPQVQIVETETNINVPEGFSLFYDFVVPN